MALLKCKMCGGELTVQENSFVCVCEYCGSQQTVPNVDDEKKVNLFGRANKLRSINEFDKAYSVYESIVEDFPDEAESYWGLVLCKYGIEYVDDPKTRTKIPTCHRSSFDSVLENENYLKAIQKSNPLARELYVAEANAIETIRRGILEISSKEEPYDIFICYKETDRNGERTHDSVLAQNIYQELTEKGYRVFFSRITLEDKLGVKYEPYIFSALHSSKVMLVVGMDGDHLNAVWVKNEWSRYLKLIEAGEKKTLIPCYKGIDAYDLPEEFSDLQGQDMGKVGAIQDLVRGIEKIIPKSAPAQAPVQQVIIKDSGANVTAFLKRAKMAMSDNDFEKAEELLEKALEADDTCSDAYLGLDLVKFKVKSVSALAIEYALAGGKLSSNIKEARRLNPNAPWVKEFETVYAKNAYRHDYDISNTGVLIKYKGNSTNVNIINGVTAIGSGAFSENKNIVSVIIPPTVTRIGKGAFLKCENLTSVTIPQSVTTIEEYAFYNCSKLSNIAFAPGLQSIGANAFFGCKSLTGVRFPNSLTTIGDKAFSHSGLTTVAIPNTIKNMGTHVFEYCKNLTSAIMQTGIKVIREGIFYESGIRSFVIPDGVATVEKYALNSCYNLTSVKIPASVTTIGDNAFYGSSNLSDIEILRTVTYLGHHALKYTKAAEDRTIKGVCPACGGSYPLMLGDNCKKCGRSKYNFFC